MKSLRPLRSLSLVAFAVACSGTPPEKACGPGELEVCSCEDGGESGIRECGANGTFGTCECSDGGSGGTNSGDGSGGETATGGSATGGSSTGGSATGGAHTGGTSSSSGGANAEDCDDVTVACAYTATEFPDEATQKDADSNRSEQAIFAPSMT